MISTKKRLSIWALVIISLLSIPFIAMQFSNEVNWDFTDFLVMGILLSGIALAYELIARSSTSIKYRTAFGIGLAAGFLLMWVNGAVGIIGNEDQDANLLYVVVLLFGFVGSLLARFKSKGMARTLFIAAFIQMFVPVVALIFWPPSTTSWSPSIPGVFMITGFFAMLFVLSGFMFRESYLTENDQQE